MLEICVCTSAGEAVNHRVTVKYAKSQTAAESN
jgi:hypothetical protein